MVDKYDAKEVEKQVLEFWKKNKIYEKAREKNKAGKPFYFLQGPPYTSGKIHIGHAWNNCLKDMALRYKRMKGFNVWDRAGYDMHGLPTEHQVMKLHKLETKGDIIKFGEEKFAEECRKFGLEKAQEMNVDLSNLGVWMDFDNAYMPIKNSYMENEWWLIKTAHKKGRLYEGEKTMGWCAECETALAKHEMEYKKVTDDSIFLKFKIKDKDNEYLVIWTTTPWTIPLNMGIMVHPEFDYVKIEVEGEKWIVAKGLAGTMMGAVVGKPYKIIEEMKGAELEGTEYIHPLWTEVKPFAKLKQKHPKTHTVILSDEYVDLSAGTGLVHTAPGCGPEDYEVGHRNNIPPFNPLTESGYFPDTMGKFSGWKAKRDDAKFIKDFEERGFLIATTPVEHDYAHCERCHNPIIYRATKQWFFKVEDFKQKMVDANKEIYWNPKAGQNAFGSWLENLRDNSITKQRFWGTPIPIWKCECGNYEVIGNAEELKKKAVNEVPENLHKPWIDNVLLKCEECGKEMKRLPDVLDVWIDAGTASWNCLDYPKQTELFEKYFPADFILEGKDQIRGWFNLLMVASMIALEKPSFKACFMHGFVTDVEGEKMSKSMGNYVSPDEFLEKYCVDALRYYFCSTKAGEDINFVWDEAELRYRNLFVYWNIHKFLIDLSKETGKNPAKLEVDKKKFGLEEKYILSKLHNTIKKVTQLNEEYRLDEIPDAVEELLMELSRTYIQLVRDKAAIGTQEEKETVLYVIYNVLSEGLKLFSTLCPFITEKIYQNMKSEFGLKEESIHLMDWPGFEQTMIDEVLEKQMGIMGDIIRNTLGLREKIQVGLRWPLNQLVVTTYDGDVSAAVSMFEDILKKQINVKQVDVRPAMPGVKIKIKANFATLGKKYEKLVPQIVARLGQESGEAVVNAIDKHGKFEMKIDRQVVEIKREDINIEKDIPEPYVNAGFNKGELYLDTEMTPELKNEGYAREIMRRVQSGRKEAGLEKVDDIELWLKVDEQLKKSLGKFEEQIKAKCGAKLLTISMEAPKENFDHNFADEVKAKGQVEAKSFEAWFSKV